MAEAHFRRNVFYPFDDHIISEVEWRFPNEVIPMFQVSYFMLYTIYKLNEFVLGSMEQYFDHPRKGSLIQEVERWKKKIEYHEINFNTLMQTIAAANCEFFPSINYMLKTLHNYTNQVMLLWVFHFCLQAPGDLLKNSTWQSGQENCVVIILYCACFALCSLQYFIHFCTCKLQVWHSFGLY